MTSWTSLPTEEAFITLRALGRVALTVSSSILSYRSPAHYFSVALGVE